MVLEFAGALAAILAAAYLFTNAVEMLGGRLELGQGAVGSVLAAYAYYVRRALSSGGAMEEVPERLTLWRFGSRPPTWAVVAQLVIALVLIVVGAQVFVDAVELSSEAVGLPAGLGRELAPLATELPEKLNSIIWVRDGKDTLALGNITGAMVFQSTIPVAIGVLFTPWVLGPAQHLLSRPGPRLRRPGLPGAAARRPAPLLAVDDRRDLLRGFPGRRRLLDKLV
ncbi:MAG: hypothetical protein WKF95_06850 [Rubrobacter sp.]